MVRSGSSRLKPHSPPTLCCRGRAITHADLTLPAGPAAIFGSALLDLAEIQFDRHGAAEDRNLHLEPRALLIDFLDEAVERGERTIGNADLLADLEGDRGLRPLDAFLDLVQDAFGFLVRRSARAFVPRKPVTFGVFLIR